MIVWAVALIGKPAHGRLIRHSLLPYVYAKDFTYAGIEVAREICLFRQITDIVLCCYKVNDTLTIRGDWGHYGNFRIEKRKAVDLNARKPCRIFAGTSVNDLSAAQKETTASIQGGTRLALQQGID
jgi:hypothetical protein